MCFFRCMLQGAPLVGLNDRSTDAVETYAGKDGSNSSSKALHVKTVKPENDFFAAMEKSLLSLLDLTAIRRRREDRRPLSQQCSIFLQSFPGRFIDSQYSTHIETLRPTEYPQLQNQIYLDHAGATPYPASLVTSTPRTCYLALCSATRIRPAAPRHVLHRNVQVRTRTSAAISECGPGGVRRGVYEWSHCGC
ncbi:hypothetical protein DFJ77DRAFT_188251 [Powellomyces hirtus]|nr:hypothetical protein DFJ77DRAFT_188251 [Powellomyces hirtus]